MKRFIYSAIVVMLMVCGCQYHPFYDGQPLRLYNSESGIIENDGGHVYVSIVSIRDFEIEIYGGKGKNHEVSASVSSHHSKPLMKNSMSFP